MSGLTGPPWESSEVHGGSLQRPASCWPASCGWLGPPAWAGLAWLGLAWLWLAFLRICGLIWLDFTWIWLGFWFIIDLAWLDLVGFG